MKDIFFELNYIMDIIMQLDFNREQKVELISTLQKSLSNLEQLEQ